MPVLDLNDKCEAGELVRSATRALAEAGVETPGLDARRLLEAATGLSAAQLIAGPDTPVAAAVCARF